MASGWQEAFSVGGRSVIVTGASRGIGAGIARAFGEAGARVALAARSAEGLAAVREEIEGAGGQAIAVPTDVGDDTQLQRLVDETLAAFGGVDVLVNNAAAPRLAVRAPAEEMKPDLFDETMRVNLRAAWMLSRLVAKEMLASGGGGSIINIGSVAQHSGMPGMSPYGASKGGLARMSESMAWDWGRRGIRVNTVAPGFIETDENRHVWGSAAGRAEQMRKTPVGRTGQPEGRGLRLPLSGLGGVGVHHGAVDHAGRGLRDAAGAVGGGRPLRMVRRGWRCRSC